MERHCECKGLSPDGGARNISIDGRININDEEPYSGEYCDMEEGCKEKGGEP